MDKNEYFSKSESEQLPKRCPLIGRCGRYASSILLLAEIDKYGKGITLDDKLINEGYLVQDFEKDGVPQAGAPVEATRGTDFISFSNSCPEVTLFENRVIFGIIPEKPIIAGCWDRFWRENQFGDDGKFKVYKEGHFSECAEFAFYQMDRPKKKKRSPAPMTYVYLMLDNHTGRYKIGRSVNPKFRERTLQSQEPDVELVETWLAPPKLETELHRKFHEKRYRGEWFDLNESDVVAIFEIMDSLNHSINK